MAFHVYIPDSEQAYLDGLPLSPEAKALVSRFVEEFLADVPGQFRLDPANRLGPDSPYFRVRHIFSDRWGDGRLHSVDFYVRDDQSQFGVLLIVYIECH